MTRKGKRSKANQILQAFRAYQTPKIGGPINQELALQTQAGSERYSAKARILRRSIRAFRRTLRPGLELWLSQFKVVTRA
jgi:hypothetical protein